MVMIGEEKRIQALFRELRQDDERIAPQFVMVWNRAQAESLRPQRTFNLSLVVTTALLLVALFSLALWFSYRQPTRQQIAAGLITPAAPTLVPSSVALPSDPTGTVPVKPYNRAVVRQRALRLAARRRAEIPNAVISSWQSPTVRLMQSPAEDVLSSLPQLSRSADELKSFLPETTQ
jgi:hypothetical protein